MVHAIYRASAAPGEGVEELLARRVYAILGTNNSDGTVHTVPVLYAFHDGRFLFESSRATRKVRNVAGHGRARVLVEHPRREGWVAACGPASVIARPRSEALNELVYGRYMTEAGRAAWAATVAPLDDVTIELVPESWSSWDVTGMFALFEEHGHSAAEAAGWFLPLDD